MINIFQPSLGSDELNEIKKVFDSNWIGKGNYVLDFEKKFSHLLNKNSDNFISTNSCTEAIFLASEIFDFNKKDEILVPSINFIAIPNAIISKGAKPIFTDVDSRSLNVRAIDLEKKISKNTKAIFINHYGGVPCEMDEIIDLCKEKNILLIEDSACAPLSFYKGIACGTMGDMGMWSFDAMKIISTGDGGMIYFKSKDDIIKAKEQLYFGLPPKSKSGLDSSNNNKSGWWEIEVNRPGRRAIMNNISGAIGLKQLEKINSFISRRKQIYDLYNEELSKLEWLKTPPDISSHSTSSYYFYWIQTNRRDELAIYLKENGIYTTFRYWPLHKVNFFKSNHIDLPNADQASRLTLNLPIHQDLSNNDLDKIVDLIKKFN